MNDKNNINKSDAEKPEKAPLDKKVLLKRIFKILITIVIVVICYFIYSAMNKQISNVIHYVVFDSNGGSNIKTLEVKYNEVATKPEDPTREGYKFKYWALNNKEYDFNSRVKSNTTLVAVWEKEDKKEDKKENKEENTETKKEEND